MAAAPPPDRPSRALDPVLATLSHEIRTPLNGVLGMAGLLATTRLDDTQRAYLQTLRDCGEHLLNLVNDVLVFAKLDAGRVELEAVETDVEKLLQGVAELLSPKAYEVGAEIAWWADPDAPVLVTDDGRLRQILFNLAGNALKFVESGGAVLSAEVKGRAKERARLRFSVSDTGPGLSPSDASAVFEEFVQTEAGARAGGAGLGLTIVKRLADAFGGEVGVDSRPGEGACFWFEAEFGVLPRPTRPQRLKGLAVGVVSANPVVLAAALRQISAAGGEGVAAREARALPERVCAVLMDGAGGRTRPVKSRPTLILLAPEERRRIAPARTQGFAGYLIKPLRGDSLADRILASLGVEPGASAAETAHRAPAPREDERAQPLAARGARVLLVEDNPVNALLARALLNREGCAVERAASGGEALQAVAKAPFDLILMDLRLPDFDGVSAARALLQDGVTTPIVALTANSFEDDRQACLAVGMVDFLTKPLDPAALKAVLHRWLRPIGASEPNDGAAPGSHASRQETLAPATHALV